MECRCPNCGKIVNLSREALAELGNMVVCPQCLEVFAGSADEDLMQKMSHKAADVQKVTPSPFGEPVARCIHCGGLLAANMRFCPYCGVTTLPENITNKDADVVPDVDVEATPATVEAPRPFVTDYRYQANKKANRAPVTTHRSAPLYIYVLFVVVAAILYALHLMF